MQQLSLHYMTDILASDSAYCKACWQWFKYCIWVLGFWQVCCVWPIIPQPLHISGLADDDSNRFFLGLPPLTLCSGGKSSSNVKFPNKEIDGMGQLYIWLYVNRWYRELYHLLSFGSSCFVLFPVLFRHWNAIDSKALSRFVFQKFCSSSQVLGCGKAMQSGECYTKERCHWLLASRWVCSLGVLVTLCNCTT
jgi:hypothetical protein